MSEPAWIPVGPAAVLDVGPEVAYGEITASVSVTATTEAGATPLVTAPAFTADGTSQYLIEFFCPNAQAPGTSGSGLYFVLFQDGVSIGYIGAITATAASGPQEIVRCTRRLIPAAGARVYSVRAFASASCTIQAGPGGLGAYVPTFIRVTKVPSAVAGPSGLVPPTAIGTALPASPVDGQEFILTDSLTAPTYTWHLRYVAAKATNKWVFVGGSPKLVMNNTVADSQSSSGSFQFLANNPSMSIPVTGRYEVSAFAGFQNVAATASQVYIALARNDTNPLGGTPQPGYNFPNLASIEGHVSIPPSTVDLVAGDSLRLLSYITASTIAWGGTGGVRGRAISACPIAIGG